MNRELLFDIVAAVALVISITNLVIGIIDLRLAKKKAKKLNAK